MTRPTNLKMRTPIGLYAICFLSSALAACADEPLKQAGESTPVIREGERLLFVGNSYMANEGGVFHYLAKSLSVAKGPTIHTDQHIYYGKPLSAMFTEGVQSAIRSPKYDSVVITSGQPSAMRKFDQLIRSNQKKTIVFMTWQGRHPGNRASVDEYTAATRKAVDEMRALEKETGAIIVPVAVVYHELTLNPPPGMPRVDYLWRPGNIHQNELGTMVNAWMLYTMFTGKTPVNVDFDMPPLVVGDTLKNNPDIPFHDDLKRQLQQRVWSVANAWRSGRTHLE